MRKSIILNKSDERVHDFLHGNWRKCIIKSVIWIISLKFIKMSLSLFLKDRISIFKKVWPDNNLLLLKFNIWVCEFISLMPNTSKIWCQPELADNLAFSLCTVVPLHWVTSNVWWGLWGVCLMRSLGQTVDITHYLTNKIATVNDEFDTVKILRVCLFHWMVFNNDMEFLSLYH